MVAPASTWLQRLKERFDPTPILSVEPDGLAQRLGGKRASIRWDEVQEIAAETVCKVTYDENFLILVRRDGSIFTMGELDRGVQEASAALDERFPGLPPCWQTFLNAAEPAFRRVIWRRDGES